MTISKHKICDIIALATQYDLDIFVGDIDEKQFYLTELLTQSQLDKIWKLVKMCLLENMEVDE